MTVNLQLMKIKQEQKVSLFKPSQALLPMEQMVIGCYVLNGAPLINIHNDENNE